MKQIAPLLYQWSQYDAEHEVDHNGHFVQAVAGTPGALIDPVALPPSDAEHVTRLGGAGAVLFTSRGIARERAAAAAHCTARFGCPVRVPARGAASGRPDLGAGAGRRRGVRSSVATRRLRAPHSTDLLPPPWATAA